jgi:hypothetical protein
VNIVTKSEDLVTKELQFEHDRTILIQMKRQNSVSELVGKWQFLTSTVKTRNAWKRWMLTARWDPLDR